MTLDRWRCVIAVRRESVILDLQDNFTAGMAKAAVATELLDKNLDHLGGTNVSTSRQIDRTTASNERLGQSSRSASKDVDKYASKVSLLADAAIVLGPALVPLGATTIPVLTTALAGLGASAAGIGTAILAFHGIGDAIKAIDTYKLAPTVENLSKLRAEEAKFGPAGTRFATYISSLEPDLQRLQQVARAGLFPGLEDGIGVLLTKLPQVRQVLHQVATGMGDLAREGGQALAGGKFSGFFAYLKTDAEPTMASFARSTGHLVETFTNLMVAFAPLNRNLTGGIEGATAALAKWSEGLSGNNSFQSFLTYLETNGPKAIALLDSLVGTFASIVQAAAPIGANLLPLLTDLSDVIGAIARSDLGTPLVAGLVALRLFSRAQQGIGAIADTSFGKVLSGQREATSGFTKASSAAKRFATDLENVARYGNLATESSSRLKGTLATFGRGSAGIAGLALATSGLADKFGLGHTASLALIGAMAGPEGAVAGGLIGAVLDLKDANSRASASQRDLNALIAQSPTAFSAQAQAIDSLRKKNSDFWAQQAKDQKTLGDFSPLNVFKPSEWAAYGRSVEQALGIINSSWDDSTSKALADSQKMQVAIATIARGTGDTSVPTPQAFAQGQAGFIDTVKGPGQNVETLNALQAAATKLQPTLNALGISFDDLGKMTPAQLQATVGAIKAYNTRAESTKSMNQAVAASFRDLDNQMDSTSESASNVADSLDALLNPKLSLSAASDAWAAGLRNLTKDLDKSSRSLVGNTDAADKNRAAIRDRVTSLVAVLDAQAKAGASAGKLTHTLQDGRQALIKQGEAAGFSKAQMVAYVNQLGLTPKLVKTVIQANTAQAQANVNALLNGIANLHDRTVTIRMNTVHTDSSGVSFQHGGAHSEGGLAGTGRFTGRPVPRSARRFARGGMAGLHDPLFTSEGPRFYKAAYKHNSPFAVPNPFDKNWPYQTPLTRAQEAAFEQWVNAWNIPFQMGSHLTDYDMRGFWKKKHPKSWTEGQHFPDTFKTPYDTTFSHESKYATADNPFYWHGDKLIDVRTGQVVFAPAPGGEQRAANRAEGGSVFGPGGPRDDLIPAWLSNREFVQPVAAVDYYGVDFMEAVRTLRFADGGSPSGRPSSSGPNGGGHTNQFVEGITSATSSLQVWKNALDASKKELDKEKQARADAIQAFKDAESSISGQLMADPFQLSAASGNSWSAGASGGKFDPTGNLANEQASATAYISNIQKLSQAGLSQAALNAIIAEGPEVVARMAQFSASQLSAYNSQYAATSAVVAQAAQYGATAEGLKPQGFGKEIRDIRSDIHTLTATVKTLTKENNKGHAKTAHAAASAGSNAAAAARRRGRGH